MRGLLLAGGRGTRLRPLTHTSSKQLVPIANKPILFYGIEALVAAGIGDIGIIVGDTAPEITAAVGDGSRFGACITYIRQEAPLGLAHAVATARSFLGEDRFVMYLGDNLIRDGIVPIVEEFRVTSPDAMILLARVREPQRFGVAELADGRVVRLVEKPEVPPSELALVGVYLFSAAIHEAIARIDYSARGELEITDALQRMIDDGHSVIPHTIAGWWKDTGRLEDMLEANRLILESIETDVRGEVAADVRLEGRVVVGDGCTLSHCTVRGPVIIGAGTVIDDAYVGPFTAIQGGCRIRRAEIEHSIVLESSTIEDVSGKIESSLIGKECRVRQSPHRPRAIKLMLGDHSVVEVI